MANSPEWAMQLQSAVDWSLFLRLTLAAVLGGIVGVERELTGRVSWSFPVSLWSRP